MKHFQLRHIIKACVTPQVERHRENTIDSDTLRVIQTGKINYLAFLLTDGAGTAVQEAEYVARAYVINGTFSGPILRHIGSKEFSLVDEVYTNAVWAMFAADPRKMENMEPAEFNYRGVNFSVDVRKY